jgi:hypothetical protein
MKPKPKQPKPSKQAKQAQQREEPSDLQAEAKPELSNEERFRRLLHQRGLLLVGFVVSSLKVQLEISDYSSDLVVQVELGKRQLEKSMEVAAEDVAFLAWRAIKGG